jgi:glutamate synthase (NADPH/NADH) small chain
MLFGATRRHDLFTVEIRTVKLDWKDGKMSEIAGSEWTHPADFVFPALGFVSPVASLLEAFGVVKDARGNARATDGHATNVPRVFAAGAARRG